ncbi:MMPL domain-containing protein [Mycolicibacterium brisbanense]|uniref:MMPL domain-containing protein n=1 Tax=Mycolicibacterium brisbanense TaxID=146020 RepID=A0A100W0P6_9MYCO|nr:MMPL domain-containing protein [Mycolicibacterium brisbanense]
MSSAKGTNLLHRIARLAIAAPRLTVSVAALVMVVAAVFGIPVAKSLSPTGFEDPASESAIATRMLADRFGQGDQQLVFVVSSPDGADSTDARRTGTAIVDDLHRSPHVASVTSAWTVPPAAAAQLISRDGRSGLVVAGITGGERDAPNYANTLSEQILRDHGSVTVRAGGPAMVNAGITEQTQKDLLLMESIAIPLSFLVLVWVFGGLLAAALPVMVAVMAIAGALAVLRLITFTTDVSIFALNLSTAMGLALAIDYTLLIISRYRDELADGAGRDDALERTMVTAGRTVLFSATTVALSMAALILFPMHFLKSLAYAGVATVTFAAIVAVVVTPAVIVLLGTRLDALDVRRLLRRSPPRARPVEQQFWYRSTRFVMRHAISIGLAVVTLLVLLGVPFLGVKWGFPDDRVLPSSASPHQVGDQLRTGFDADPATSVSVVIPDANGIGPQDITHYAADLSRVPGITAVSTPMGTFVNGVQTGPPSAATGEAQGSVFLTAASTAPLFSSTSETQLDQIHALAGPGGRTVYVTGTAQTNRDTVNAIMSRLPGVLGVIAVISLLLLFMLTGSVLLPLKALVLNVLSLSAAFGAMVWIFQDGNLGGLGTTATGTLVTNMPVVLFCIAFGLSMDYEVFLVSRIREFWLASERTCAAADESVALGVAHTGRVITAAALVMSISFAALTAAHVSFMRMFGLGLTLAILVDATLVRTVLVPAFMHLMGTWSWWAPAPLVWLHKHIGITHGEPAPAAPKHRLVPAQRRDSEEVQ